MTDVKQGRAKSPAPATPPEFVAEVRQGSSTRRGTIEAAVPKAPDKPRRYLFLVVIAVLAAVALGTFIGLRYWGSSGNEQLVETVEIRRGNLVATVSATGALSAVGTVTVGTQVSGTIARVFADFNDRVTKGDLLAVLDTETIDAVVTDSLAGVSRAQAGLGQAEAEASRARSQVAQTEAQRAGAQETLERNQLLFDEGLISLHELATLRTATTTTTTAVQSAEAQVAAAKAGIASAGASVGSAQAQLTQALKNRRNAEIRAPISGLVIERSVDAGQTVAASFSTPTLFVIAEDLAQMEILVQVDESDVGLVAPGQQVEFNVAAYPGRSFTGKVRERRLQPEKIQNVVHYTVVVTADNESGLLLPGMTATVDFIVDRLEGALLAPAAALRFDPPHKIRAAAREQQRQDEKNERGEAPSEVQATLGFSPDVAELWIPGDKGRLSPLLVRVLATDGAMMAIAPLENSNNNLRAGLEVVTRMNQTEKNPFK